MLSPPSTGSTTSMALTVSSGGASLRGDVPPSAGASTFLPSGASGRGGRGGGRPPGGGCLGCRRETAIHFSTHILSHIQWRRGCHYHRCGAHRGSAAPRSARRRASQAVGGHVKGIPEGHLVNNFATHSASHVHCKALQVHHQHSWKGSKRTGGCRLPMPACFTRQLTHLGCKPRCQQLIQRQDTLRAVACATPRCSWRWSWCWCCTAATWRVMWRLNGIEITEAP